MATNNTAPALPILKEGMKVRLIANPNNNNPIAGQLRYGADLKTEFIPGKVDSIYYDATHNHVYTVHARENVPISITPAFSPQNPDPLGFRYHLKLHMPRESRTVDTYSAPVKNLMAHTNLRDTVSVAGNTYPTRRFKLEERAILIKAMALQPMGAVSPKQYPAGQMVKIVSTAKSSKDKSADPLTPAALCKYEIVIVESKVYKDIFWKTKYPLYITSLQVVN